MLIDDPNVIKPQTGEMAYGQKLTTGCYLINHLGHSGFLPNYKTNVNLDSIDPYGVCDNHEQLLRQFLEKNDPDRQFVITLTEIKRENQPPIDGWRWRKWGNYIGDHKIQHEYLYDEKEIDKVYVYAIYEK